MRCLVTVGTTKFEELIRAVDSPAFAEALERQGFRELVLQTGTGSYLPSNLVPKGQNEGHCCGGSLRVRHFTFTSNLGELMSTSSLIISHAGSGSIFEALTTGAGSKASLIVVPNPNLMDNHQAELGEHLAAMGHLACAAPDAQSLVATVDSLPSKQWVPYAKGTANGIAEHINSIVLAS